MDEILIEEKKYVSSKRAAKVTGYAKDYIGQLCREGRVPARLVGRSWYVLETAIHDHRFGDQKIDQEDVAKTARHEEGSAPVFQSTWEPPRYEASSAEVLPSVNRMLEANSQASTGGEDEVSQHLQDSWKAWFDRVADTTQVIPDIIPEKPVAVIEEEEVKVPINTIHRLQYQPPSEELLPKVLTQEVPSDLVVVPSDLNEERRRGIWPTRTIHVIGAILAVLAVALAFIGSGYFDKYIISNSQVRIIAGITIYNK